MKKALAIVFCLALVICCFSCTGEKPDVEEVIQPETDVADTPLTDDDAEHTEEEDIPPAPETVYTSADSNIVMTVGDKSITEAMLRYYLLNYAKQYGGDDKKLWEDQAIESIKKYIAIEVLCDRLGVVMGDEQKEHLDYLIAYTVDMYNGKEDTSYEEALSDLYLTDALNRSMMGSGIRANMLYSEYITEGGIMWGATDDDIVSYISENYVRIKHILISTADLDDAQKAEARKRAEKVHEQAVTGTSFEELITQYSEDSMDVGTGYYFTRGEKVQELEDKAFELDVGEISDIVESAYGYHIVKKYELDRSFVLADEALRNAALSSICEKAYTTDIEIVAQGLKVKYHDNYKTARDNILAELQ